ncbi:centrosomal protein of 95 kDa-like isoform X2 [Littorina saxatilis]|uniref:DUF5745 domain-containing protein n=1 Tax=Littorina saxatilis TaxID=31220 RepID=A0AAN9BXQ3_9CAEN
MDDFSGLEYDQESVSEEDVVTKTNNLLSQFNVPTQITSVSDIAASLFVVLYESLFSDRLPGIVRQPVTREDEIHNCQMVIDVLSADVIKDNLSHIRGVDIVEGKVQAINNLVDIFSFLYEYVIKQIESDGPTDTEDDTRSLDRQSLAAGTTSPFVPVDAQDLEGGGDYGSLRGQNGATGIGSNDSLKGATNGARGNGKPSVMGVQTDAPPSPIRRNISSSLMGHGTFDSTEELIQEGERLGRRQNRENRDMKGSWERQGRGDSPDSPGKFDFIGVRPVPTTVTSSRMEARKLTSPPSTATIGDAYLESALPVISSAAVRGGHSSAGAHASHQRHPGDSSTQSPTNLSATAPMPRRTQNRSSPERLRSTIGAVPYHSRQTPEKPYQHREAPLKGLSSSYMDLHNMVQHTAAMTRAAIDTSPLHRRRDRASLLDITDLSQERRQVPHSEAHDLARELNLSPSPRRYQGGESSEVPLGGRERRQVAFHDKTKPAGRENIPPKTYTIPPNTDYALTSPGQAVRPTNKQRPGKKSPSRMERSRPSKTEESGQNLGRLKDRLVDALADVHSTGSEDEGDGVRRRRAESKEQQAKMSSQQAKMSSKLNGMGKPTLAGAHRRLETEDVMYSRQHDYLKKLYEEEFEDVVEEVKHLVQKDHRLMNDMEEEYKKLMVVADEAPRKAKPLSKTKGYLLPTAKRSKPQGAKAAQKKASGTNQVKVRERPLAIGENEELMPVLMEEFPHLYLSGQTWHELWRKGLNQIENLTQAYEENKRRKSKAQAQLEEAARKHEILAAIVKKQLESNHRMHEVKDQKKQQLTLKNKLHEKRAQSARARRYYNEYQVRSRSKMLKRRTREELIFKNLFKDGLAIQKERIRDVQKYAKEQRDKNALKRQDEIDSLENYYRDQFEMLVGKLVQDRQDMSSREKAHQRVLEQMKKDLRRKMEKEIGTIQSEMFRDDDDTYFRQLEADRLRQELHVAKFQVRV